MIIKGISGSEINKFFMRGTSFFLFMIVFSILLSCKQNNPILPDETIAYSETVVDVEGNVYHAIKFGDQVWTIENLRTKKFNDGTSITLDTAGATWADTVVGKYCYLRNTTDIDSITKFGALYNWCAVNSKKLAPVGWHIPTDSEWTVLENHLIDNGFNWDNTRRDNKISKSLAAKTSWNITTQIGAPGNDLSLNNRSGFSGFPGGRRLYTGPGQFDDYRVYCFWWSATADDAIYVHNRYLTYMHEKLYSGYCRKEEGASVRVVKN